MKEEANATAREADRESAGETPASAQPEQPSQAKQQEKLRHDVNNALSVIYGNTQLLAEMARARDLGKVFTDPLEDIEEAQADISHLLDQLERFHEEVDDS